jgi:predicted RNA polymerase sigma factor
MRPVPGLACEARGELLGRTAQAREAYHRTLELVHDNAERRLFERRLEEFEAGA